ncbi:hypothetical protein FACS1894189_0090 [Planctomycetales bacterium]|nr:hypothetical protein FACS1894189_0090 [Planctomycetales bacterium]
MEHADVSADLTKGDWLVTLYGMDCTKCEKHFEEWKAKGFSESGSVALLEITGQPKNALRSRFDDGTWHWGCLKRTNDWYVETPCVIKLENGVVKSVTFNKP